MNSFFVFDKHLFISINQVWTNKLLDPLMVGASSEKFWLIAGTGIFILSYLFYKNSKIVSYICISVIALGITDLFTFRILKQQFQRSRPCYVLKDSVRLLEDSCGSVYGFPSNHAANAMAFFVISILLIPSFRWLWMLIPIFIVGYSRVYVGVHYPFDVLAGFLDGALVSLTLFGFLKATETWRNNLLQQALDFSSKAK